MDILKQTEKKNYSIVEKKNNFLSLFIIVLAFIVDRISKIKIIGLQLNDGNKIYINDYINFDLVWNTGIGFGLLNFNSTLVYNVISFTIGIVLIILIYLVIKSQNLDKVLFSAVLGGALGNFYDRLTFFAVPDFIDLHYQNYHWFTFNFADIFITVGIVGLIFKEFLKKEKNE